MLSVNYRLGIGYGHDFHRPPNAGAQGAAEYQDVKAAGEYLRTLPQVDPTRIGIYCGSYGAFSPRLLWRAIHSCSPPVLTSTACTAGHRSVPNLYWRIATRNRQTREQHSTSHGRSSPVSSIATWKSPVLLIHCDDDRNVRFTQTTDLVGRLEKATSRSQNL